MAYSSITKPSDYFNTVLYTGNAASSHAITGVGFQPDWIWLKNRDASGGEDHGLFDSVRGVDKWLSSNTTAAETNYGGGYGVLSFDSDGFTVGNGTAVNQNSQKIVGWNWLAANSTASNSDGGTSSTVSVNTTAGLSIVGWAGAGSATTVGHGLGVAPKVVLVKNRSEVYGWQMYHESLGNGKYVSLNSTDAVATSSQSWNDTSPTSSVFSVGASDSNNKSGNNIIAYCFAEKTGYSKFGSYTGNGNADGTFVYTGFKPAWVMLKKTSGADDWALFDNKRDVDNVTEHLLRANTNAAEEVHANFKIDLLSNGFKLKTTDGKMNGSSATYIYMAFAEHPFVTAGTKAAGTAR